jgi:hypothetical protein
MYKNVEFVLVIEFHHRNNPVLSEISDAIEY